MTPNQDYIHNMEKQEEILRRLRHPANMEMNHTNTDHLLARVMGSENQQDRLAIHIAYTANRLLPTARNAGRVRKLVFRNLFLRLLLGGVRRSDHMEQYLETNARNVHIWRGRILP